MSEWVGGVAGSVIDVFDLVGVVAGSEDGMDGCASNIPT